MQDYAKCRFIIFYCLLAIIKKPLRKQKIKNKRKQKNNKRKQQEQNNYKHKMLK